MGGLGSAAYKNIILFDLDGTITDSEEGIIKSFQCALSHFHIPAENPDALRKLLGPPLRHSFTHFYGLSKEEAEEAVVQYRKYFAQRGIYENTLYPGIEALLKNLKNHGKTLILATSKAWVYAKTILEYHKIKDYFSFISGSELSGARSEKAEVIRYALEQNAISSLSQVIMVGDREHDIAGAREAGVDSAGVTYGYGRYDELAEANADYIVASVEELERLLLEP